MASNSTGKSTASKEVEVGAAPPQAKFAIHEPDKPKQRPSVAFSYFPKEPVRKTEVRFQRSTGEAVIGLLRHNLRMDRLNLVTRLADLWKQQAVIRVEDVKSERDSLKRWTAAPRVSKPAVMKPSGPSPGLASAGERRPRRTDRGIRPGRASRRWPFQTLSNAGTSKPGRFGSLTSLFASAANSPVNRSVWASKVSQGPTMYSALSSGTPAPSRIRACSFMKCS